MPQPPKSPRVGEEVDVADLVPIGAEVDPSQLEDESTAPEGSAVSRFASGVWENVNPVTIVKGIGQAVTDPVGTAGALWDAQKGEWVKAKDLAASGHYSEAAGHGAAAITPLIGPMAARAGETIKSGNVAGGLGQAVGLLAPIGVKPALRVTRAALPTAATGRVAGQLQRAAEGKITATIAPQLGSNKIRFGNDAREVAPRLVAEPGMGAASVERFTAKVGEKLTSAEQLLDEATDARLEALTFDTAPIRDAIVAKRRALTSEAVKASDYPRTFAPDATGRGAGPKAVGQDVVARPHAARVAVLDQALEELDQLGPKVSYEAIKRLRQAYDVEAKAVYHPSMTADFLKAQGGKYGSADVAGAYREHLGKWDPATAAANAEYAYWRKTSDVLQALEETELGRAKVGRALVAKMTGGLVGTAAGGAVGGAIGATAGAAAGAFLTGLAEAAIGAGPTAQITVARQMARLAAALRKGDTGAATAAAFNLRKLAQGLTVRTGRAAEQARTQQAGTPQPATP